MFAARDACCLPAVLPTSSAACSALLEEGGAGFLTLPSTNQGLSMSPCSKHAQGAQPHHLPYCHCPQMQRQSQQGPAHPAALIRAETEAAIKNQTGPAPSLHPVSGSQGRVWHWCLRGCLSCSILPEQGGRSACTSPSELQHLSKKWMFFLSLCLHSPSATISSFTSSPCSCWAVQLSFRGSAPQTQWFGADPGFCGWWQCPCFLCKADL